MLLEGDFMIKLDIGKRIYDRRMALGMSQAELAEKTGYKSRSSINKIELGINDVPQSKIKLFADALDISIEYLMKWDKKEIAEEPLSDLEKEFIELLRLIPQDSQPLVLSMIKAALKSHNLL